MTGSVSISDILLLLDQDWVPDKKKEHECNECGETPEDCDCDDCDCEK